MTRRALIREIAAALVFKAIALTLLYLAFFGPQHRTIVTPERAAARLFADDSSERRP